MKNTLFYILLSLVVFSSCTTLRKLTSSYNDYCKLLEEYSQYSDKKSDVDFEYNIKKGVDGDDELVMALKDSIQELQELDKALYLMRWVHENLEYDYGYSGSKSQQICNPRNYKSILHADSKTSAIVCRDMALTLTELFLELGFKSRLVTCMAYDTKDPDAHVVCEVRIESLDSWIMLDPSFNCYFIDGNKRILNLKAIRYAMLNNVNIDVSNDCSLNSKPFSREKYKKYMSKNVFRFSRPLKSRFNYESQQDSKYVILIPENYDKKKYSSNRYILTTNEEIFWE